MLSLLVVAAVLVAVGMGTAAWFLFQPDAGDQHVQAISGPEPVDAGADGDVRLASAIALDPLEDEPIWTSASYSPNNECSIEMTQFQFRGTDQGGIGRWIVTYLAAGEPVAQRLWEPAEEASAYLGSTCFDGEIEVLFEQEGGQVRSFIPASIRCEDSDWPANHIMFAMEPDGPAMEQTCESPSGSQGAAPIAGWSDIQEPECIDAYLILFHDGRHGREVRLGLFQDGTMTGSHELKWDASWRLADERINLCLDGNAMDILIEETGETPYLVHIDADGCRDRQYIAIYFAADARPGFMPLC